jgi:uncharacterized protein
MKIQPDTLPGANVITRYDAGCVWVGATAFRHSVLVPWRGEVLPWPPTAVAALEAGHFERIVSLGPEVVIFGSGDRLQFVAPALHRALIERGIGIETMDTAAACRTYNVLASEGRSVLAALLIGDEINPRRDL